MVLHTSFTEALAVQHPIALAPMAGSAGGALAAAVSNGGGLGLVGGGRGNRDWLARELAISHRADRQPVGRRLSHVGGRQRHRRVGTGPPTGRGDAVLRRPAARSPGGCATPASP